MRVGLEEIQGTLLRPVVVVAISVFQSLTYILDGQLFLLITVVEKKKITRFKRLIKVYDSVFYILSLHKTLRHM